MTTLRQDTARQMAAYLEDPLLFVEESLGDAVRPYPKQAELLFAAAHNRRVAVVGCNSSGKDYGVGRMVIPWWLGTHYPAKVVIFGPTHRQVYDVVWKEFRQCYYEAKVQLGGTMYQTPRWEGALPDGHSDDSYWAMGFATNDPHNIRGFHSPNLLVLITEAHGVPQVQIDAFKELNPKLLMMTGNPFTSSGEFYDAFHSARSRYYTIEISADDLPNIKAGKVVIPGMLTVEDVQERREEWGEDSDIYKRSVLGQFVDSDDEVVVSLSWVRLAMNRSAPERSEDDEPPTPVKPILGLDIARFGEDRTVLIRRDGPKARVIFKLQGKDTMSVAGRVGRYCEEHPDAGILVLDDTNLGGGVTDRLREEGMKGGWRLIPFTGGSSAHKKDRYANAITEAWWTMRQWFDPNNHQEPDVEDDPALVAQITTRGYDVQGDRRIILESKDKIRGGGRKSPDEGDALAMTFAYIPGPPNVRFLP